MLADKEAEHIRSIMAVQHDFVPQGCVEIPLYTHPHPDNLGLALSIIDQQKLEIEALKAHPVNEFFEDEPQAEELHEIMQSNTHPVKEQYKFGVDWSKDGNAVTVLKICEDGVAEVVFMDYQEVTHPVKELTLTNEEMISIYEKDWSGIKCGLGRAVEQAILLKAQE